MALTIWEYVNTPLDHKKKGVKEKPARSYDIQSIH